MKKIFLCLHITLLFLETTNPWAQAAQIAVDIFGGVAKGIAEAKLKNQEIKKENTELYKRITVTGDNSRTQINNLFFVSNIKEDFSQRVNDYKDNHLINLDDMAVVIANLYRNYVLLSKQFIRKCLDFTKKGTNLSDEAGLQSLIRISVVAIKSAFLDYIALLESYNFESQNLVQIMLTNNLKENIFQKIEVKNNLIDPRANLYDFLNKFDYFLDENDVMIGNLLTSKKLLQDNIILTFNKQTKEILDTLQKIEEKERTKDVLKESVVDITDSLDVLKDKLFVTFDNVNESTNNLENFLFKMIFIFQVSMKKLQIIVDAMDKFEDKKIFSEEDFLNYLKKEFLNNKKTIEINKGLYIDEILKYKNPLEFFKNINNFFVLVKKDISKFDNVVLRSVIRNYTKIIFEQELLYGKFVEKIKDQCSELFYMNEAIADIENTVQKIRQEKEELVKQPNKEKILRKKREEEKKEAQKLEKIKPEKRKESKKTEINKSEINKKEKEDVDDKEILIVNNIAILSKDKIGTGLQGKSRNRGKRSAKKLSKGTKHSNSALTTNNSALEMVDSKKHSFQDKQSKKKNAHQERESGTKKEKSRHKKNKGRKS